jgi:hypothetical protein
VVVHRDRIGITLQRNDDSQASVASSPTTISIPFVQMLLPGVSTIEMDQRFSGREDFWIIVAARSEDDTEIRAGEAAGGRRDQGQLLWAINRL